MRFANWYTLCGIDNDNFSKNNSSETKASEFKETLKHVLPEYYIQRDISHNVKSSNKVEEIGIYFVERVNTRTTLWILI